MAGGVFLCKLYSQRLGLDGSWLWIFAGTESGMGKEKKGLRNIKNGAWEGIAKLQSVRRGAFAFEEVPLVVVDRLAAEFAKESCHPILPIAIHDWELLVANC